MSEVDSRIEKETKLEKSDLHKFLILHDSAYRKRNKVVKFDAIVTVLNLIVLAVSFASSLLPIFVVSSALVFYTVLRLYKDWKSAQGLRMYEPANSAKAYSRQWSDSTRSGTLFSEIEPSKEESELGFGRMVSKTKLSPDSALISETFDNNLVLVDNFPVNRDLVETSGFISSNSELRHEQLKYLVSVVGSKQRAFNGAKVALDSSLRDLMEAKRPISLKKVTYFDSICTNEAFRSKLYEAPRVDTDNVNPSTFHVDLTPHFPSYPDNGVERLDSQPCQGVSGHIGATTIALTADNRIVYFHQNKDNLINPRLVSASGSGSLDLDDVANCDDVTNLKSLVRFGMARELVEESNIFPSKARTTGKIRDIARDTMITGFFRWVNRCGKPEFVGVTRLGFKFSEISSDNFEVSLLESASKKPPVNSMTDFLAYVDALEAEFEEGLSLSFEVAIRRLATTASYKGSNDASKLRLFEKSSKFLFKN